MLPKRFATRRATWTVAISWMAFIFALSSLPSSHVPSTGSSFGHFGVYFVLGVILFHAFSYETPARDRAFALAVIAASLYGVTDELHQAFVPGRVPDVVDWAVDTLGALAGASVALVLAPRRISAS